VAILWIGGEDIDFPAGTGTMAVATGGGLFRSGYARCAISNSNTTASKFLQSLAFPAGAVTDAWITARIETGAMTTNRMAFGVSLSTTSKGLFVGSGSASTKLALIKYDGTTATVLASESGTSLAVSTIYKIDMHIASYGASATVTVYVNGVALITFSGSVSVTGMTNFDSVSLPGGSGFVWNTSEVIVSDTDTRGLSLATMAPNAAGDTDTWPTGTYASVNPTTINDSNVVNTNSTGADEEFNLTDPPSGTFAVLAVKLAMRAANAAGAATNVALGLKSGGTIDSPTASTLTTVFTTYERLLATNPVTGVNFTAAEAAALQINLRSA
jgi:hypothetical protein